MAAGADREILAEGYAHLGTDKIREILPRLRQRMIGLGATVRFGSRVDDLVVEDGRATGVRLADGSVLMGGPIIVATGHSARDTWEWLLEAGVSAEPRPGNIGARIEHPQRPSTVHGTEESAESSQRLATDSAPTPTRHGLRIPSACVPVGQLCRP